ncbi:hypothetical protein LWM68_38300 [Niabella sp. W65]|nr:hypothetical protein [Niabella sp. W65]MCH7368078.1 hypothetical protein [Niabella sp. W65]ULT43702.1 hypothetical protein KRR40_09975 [Niabella sp. I65]
MKKILFVVAFLSSLTVLAQDETVKNLKKDSERQIKKDPNDTTAKVWKTGGFVGLNAAQGSLSNWAAGVINSPGYKRKP